MWEKIAHNTIFKNKKKKKKKRNCDPRSSAQTGQSSHFDVLNHNVTGLA